MRLSRLPARRLAGLAVVLVGGLAFSAGCGSPEVAPGSAKRSVTDANGKQVEVPQHPTKIVALSEPTLEGVLALGITPVGVAAARGQQGVTPYLQDKAGKLKIVGNSKEPNLGEITSVKPDLILVDATVGSRNNLDALNGIAPTVLVSGDGAEWRSAFAKLAEVLNKKADADKFVADHDAKVAAAKTEVAKYAGQSGSIVRWDSEGPRTVGSGGHSDEVLRGMGLVRPESQREKVSNRTPVVSREQLDKLDGDWMFFGTLGDKKAGEKTLADIEKSTPPFTQLKSYKAKHVVVIDGSAWTSSGGPIAVQVVLDEAKKALTA